MNKKILAGLARDAIFLAAGTGIGILAGRELAARKYENEMQAEVKNLREMNKKRMDRVEEELRQKYDLAKATTPDTVIVNVEASEEPEEEPQPKVNYSKASQDVATEKIVVVGNEAPTPSAAAKGSYRMSELEEISVPVPEDPPPYLITVTQYFDGEWEHHEKKDLDYYQNGDILLEDGNTWVMEREAMIPDTALDQFGYGSDRDDVVYVRNEKYMTDYAIHLHTEPFDAEKL